MALYFVMNIHLVCPCALNVKIKRSFKKVRSFHNICLYKYCRSLQKIKYADKFYSELIQCTRNEVSIKH